MISKQAVEEYLNRRLDEHDFLKKLPYEVLKQELVNFNPRPIFRSPMKHWKQQLIGLLLFLTYDGFLFFSDIGSGKTRVALEAFSYRKRVKEVKRGMAVVLNDVNVWNWIDDSNKHTPHLRILPLVGTSEERWEKFLCIEQGDWDFAVISYPGLAYMCSWLAEVGGKEKRKRVPNLTAIKDLMRKVSFLVFDEVHKCKNHRSLTYTICNQLCRLSKYYYGLTGTPFGRNPQDFWTQFYLIDRGETLGKTLGIYRAAFFLEKQDYFAGKVYEFDKRKKRKLRKVIKHRSIYISGREVGGMPHKRRRVIELRPTSSQKEYYVAANDALINAVRQQEIETNFIKCRMIASGFLTVKGEDDTKIVVKFDNPKLDAIESFLENIPIGAKAIIVHEFIISGNMIADHLKKLGVRFLALNGQQGREKNRIARSEFKRNPKYKVLAMNWRSGGTGLDFPEAAYMQFYESPVSPIERKQCEGRIWRRNSPGKYVYYEDIPIRGSKEIDILEYLEEGKDLFKELLRGKRR